MVNLTVNGKMRVYDGDADMPLLWYVRDDLRLTERASAAARACAAPARFT